MPRGLSAKKICLQQKIRAKLILIGIKATYLYGDVDVGSPDNGNWQCIEIV
jgi:hypothetical protein